MADLRLPSLATDTTFLGTGSSRTRCLGRRGARSHQGGAIAVMAAGSLILMLAFCGLALDIAQLYNRKMELQAVADAAALAAASQLDGTQQGLTKAMNSARAVVEQEDRTLRVKYNAEKVAWSDAAIQFSASRGPGAEWLNSGSAAASAGNLLYARVDTAALGEDYGRVQTLFMHVLTPHLGQNVVTASATAGRSSINVVPMAVCAMSSVAAAPRNNPANGGAPANVELVEHGFRRGVSYDLMRLNPNGTSPLHFVLDPEAPAGRAGNAANTAVGVLAPYVCTGTMAVASIRGANLSVFPSFPLAQLYPAFNSRFADYSGGLCHVNGAPPDANVKPYVYTAIAWMSTLRAGQAAQAFTDAGKLQTVADPVPPPASATAPAFGPLWAYARAVPFSAYSPGTPEPAGGYTPFASTAWPALYGPLNPVATGYPSGSGTPYAASGGGNFTAPPPDTRPGVRGRRILNLPLLECPVTGSSARVLGVGRFFMTVPATASALVGEFAGMASDSALGGRVELYR